MAWNVVDISRYNTISNFDKAANAIDGVIIRCGYRGFGTSGTLVKDAKFEDHYDGFLAKTKIGFYFTTAAITANEAVEEANYVVSLIHGKQCDFPIYINTDYNNSTHTGRSDDLPKTLRTEIIRTFCERIKTLGFRAGVYADDGWYNNELQAQKLVDSGYSIWVSRYSTEPPRYVNAYDIWQDTDQYSIVGNPGYVNHDSVLVDIANWGVHPGEKKDINEYTITTEGDTFVYTGSQIMPLVHVGPLILGQDFVCEYSDNIDVGTGHVKVSGINNYTGNITLSFSITPKSLSNYTLVMNPSSYKFTGEPIEATTIVEDLVRNRDYIVTYERNINVGTGRANVKGINNYQHYLRGDFTIYAQSVEDLEVQYDDSFIYTGEPIKPAVEIEGLRKDYDYEVEYSNNINVGIAYIIITGIGNYGGTKTCEFEITVDTIEDKEVVLIPDKFIYNGEACEPTVNIEGVEPGYMDIVYENNINAGTARVIITGKINFTGTIEQEFTIDPQPISNYDIEPIDLQYFTHDYIQPEVVISDLVYRRDFSLRFTDNYSPGTATVVASGIGNYTGSISSDFLILLRPIKMCDVKVGTPTEFSPYRVDGELVVKINDYIMQREFDYNILNYHREWKTAFTLVTYTLEGLGGFTDTFDFRFRVIDKAPDDPGSFDDGIYNFGDVDEGDESAEGDYNYLNIDPDADDDFDTDIPDETDYDFEALSGIYTDGYDEDNGKNYDENGDPIDPDAPEPPDPALEDDGVYNFGDIDEGDETAEGNYDFDDLDEGMEEESVANGNYDFNLFGEDQFEVGTEFELEDTPFYANYCSTKASGTKSGSYYVYKPEIVNDRVRLTKLESALETPVRNTGWFNIADLLLLGKFKVGQAAYITGRIMKYTNGKGEYFEVNDQLMYVVEVSDDEEYEYPYGVSYSLTGARVGWATFDEMERIKPNGIIIEDDDEEE